jgi:hypothetical protein
MLREISRSGLISVGAQKALIGGKIPNVAADQ